MRKYKQKAPLSLNPILDVLFLDTNADDTPFPSLHSKFRVKKSSSLKVLPRQPEPKKVEEFRGRGKSKDREEVVAGFRMSNGFGEVKRSKRSQTSEKNQCQGKQYQREDRGESVEMVKKRSATVMMARIQETEGAGRRVLSNRLRETINIKLEERGKGRKKEGLFQIVINSYRDFR